MIEPTDEMVHLAVDKFLNHPELNNIGEIDTAMRETLAAVLAIVERDVREQLADALEGHAGRLRGEPFRGGAVGIEFINGIEEAAYRIRSGDLS